MTALLTTVEGWRATARSVRWAPLLVSPVAASTVLLAVSALAGPDTPRITMLAEGGLTLTALGVGFVADDATLTAVPGSPVEAPVRLAARAAVTVPVVALGWLILLASYRYAIAAAGGGDIDVAGHAIGAVALASVTLALATLAGRWSPVPSPGAVIAGVMVGLWGLVLLVPTRWLQHLPATDKAWRPLVVTALLTAVLASREPAKS